MPSTNAAEKWRATAAARATVTSVCCKVGTHTATKSVPEKEVGEKNAQSR